MSGRAVLRMKSLEGFQADFPDALLEKWQRLAI
jgi:hypothetical protein